MGCLNDIFITKWSEKEILNNIEINDSIIT